MAAQRPCPRCGTLMYNQGMCLFYRGFSHWRDYEVCPNPQCRYIGERGIPGRAYRPTPGPALHQPPAPALPAAP